MSSSLPTSSSLGDLLNLRGRVVVVTGASSNRGIGLEVARGCAEMGANITITYAGRKEEAENNAQSIAEEFRVKAKAYHLDISDHEAVHTLVNIVIADFGHIDVFIANAGTAQPGSVVETTRKDWNPLLAPT